MSNVGDCRKKIDKHLQGGTAISSGYCDILRGEISRKSLTVLLSAPLCIMKEGKMWNSLLAVNNRNQVK